MHPLFVKANKISAEVIAAALEVHRLKGSGLMESIYEKCLIRELELRSIPVRQQVPVQIEYKGVIFNEVLKIDLLVDQCLIVELKAAEYVLPVHKAQLMSYMKLLDIPLGLLFNFHELLLKNGMHRMILSGADKP